MSIDKINIVPSGLIVLIDLKAAAFVIPGSSGYICTTDIDTHICNSLQVYLSICMSYSYCSLCNVKVILDPCIQPKISKIVQC